MQDKLLLVLLLSIISAQVCYTQTDSIPPKRSRLIGLPIVFLSPETSWGFGVAGVYTFKLPEESDISRPSQIQLGAAYTLEDQILFYLPFQVFYKDRKYNFYGELGYYRYNYFYFGNGNSFEDYDGELFGVTFPRVRLNALYQIRPNTYLGLRYWMDDYDITEVEEMSVLDTENITGQDGGFLSGLGLLAQYDNRDHIFYPRKGWFAEGVILQNGSYLGSPFNFTKVSLDVSKYISIRRTILALNAYWEWNEGDIPFNQLALLGGTKRLRGFYEGRFRDEKLALFQSEWRFPLFWRLGAVVFGGLGWVAPEINELQLRHTRYTVGAGLRILIQKQDQINVRIDFGLGPNTTGVYITVGEAF